MNLKINIDVSTIAAAFNELALEVEQDLTQGVQRLAAETHAKVAEMARTELHSSLNQFQKSLQFEEIAPGIWVVSIDEKGLWVEEGIESNKDMKPDLLKNAKNTSANGYKYRVIPFDYGKAPSQLNQFSRDLVAQIKQHLKKENVPFKKIETLGDVNKTPRLGKLHTFNIPSQIPGKGNTPALQGLSIYQSLKEGKIKRDILTFRTVSAGPASDGKWLHPGYQGKKFLDRAALWAENEFYNKILPEILDKYK